MAPKVKTLVLAFLMLLMISFSLGLPGEFDGSDAKPSLRKDGESLKIRKLGMVDSLLDYDDACANPKHDPRKKGCKNAP
ncbi:uncharacterized protein LOC115754280 isoform X2 [Rhodamnia argentea]|uniref:Uncharacterized protein LOC115754280 isoform X2 n=1 Tax=Rhodamnia argentea TaxID=178133 RepID=A0A8B8QPK5_9MYRT|nr:uncharacterized protein LOC115754280 isoform X2 [Rhodamnia argentea]